jgi:hypothetical protein
MSSLAVLCEIYPMRETRRLVVGYRTKPRRRKSVVNRPQRRLIRMARRVAHDWRQGTPVIRDLRMPLFLFLGGER